MGAGGHVRVADAWGERRDPAGYLSVPKQRRPRFADGMSTDIVWVWAVMLGVGEKPPGSGEHRRPLHQREVL